MGATSGQHVNPGEVGMPSVRRFDPGTRPYGSETFIFEKLARRLTSGSRGVINLYSERVVCNSCANLIAEFKKAFPGVGINISAGGG
ncbi:hypothetical protein I6A84_31240 [Frankia sp. CNm7]|uniref:Uncharacterized protein n=1 Tax=Frankia nepalensis TaxID=1836974 RepID=A0A937UQ41_9ACTN|nr:hypothetical protein [Frankia nepalensis]MBL7522438.1 hypothetical protein [Frankia nepalensis]MBL7626251.1 hypothetical protein [Frankia nepalensis]